MNVTLRKLLILVAATFSCLFAHSQSYDYPVKPGTEAWKKLKTHDEMVEITQVPKEVVINIKTSDLVTTCYNYPLLLDAYAHNNTKKGLETTLSKFNGYQELLKRGNAGESLLSLYSSIDIDAQVRSQRDLAAQGLFNLKVLLLELIVAQDIFLNQLTSGQLSSLQADVRNKLKAKELKKDIFGLQSVLSSAFVLAKILVKQSKLSLTDPGIEAFTSQFVLKDITVLNTILAKTDEQLKK